MARELLQLYLLLLLLLPPLQQTPSALPPLMSKLFFPCREQHHYEWFETEEACEEGERIRHFAYYINGVISSMQQCNDFLFLGTQTISLGRVGDDFWCIDPAGDPNGTYWLQGCHMVHCAYNSLWMGNFIHPDWDMFQSDHPCAEFHTAPRAISGGPVYVSDSVGRHNFKLLNKLVLILDGTILRCQHYALPTRDCLFQDPLHDAKTMLKIWNLNKNTGVSGVFNCQGGGWCHVSRRNKSASAYSILWNYHQFVFFVDKVAIRVCKNRGEEYNFFPTKKPMYLFSSIWNSYKDFIVEACQWEEPYLPCVSSTTQRTNMTLGISNDQKIDHGWILRNLIVYDNCKVAQRYTTPQECSLPWD
ncbi:hypothetical protein K1719_001295 [Acacia pycnantha]|nr:hypothetical protein K1719_001295 [Acacia pycnantha]